MEYQRITNLIGNIPDSVPTITHKIFETNSTFQVK